MPEISNGLERGAFNGSLCPYTRDQQQTADAQTDNAERAGDKSPKSGFHRIEDNRKGEQRQKKQKEVSHRRVGAAYASCDVPPGLDINQFSVLVAGNYNLVTLFNSKWLGGSYLNARPAQKKAVMEGCANACVAMAVDGLFGFDLVSRTSKYNCHLFASVERCLKTSWCVGSSVLYQFRKLAAAIARSERRNIWRSGEQRAERDGQTLPERRRTSRKHPG
ncbi:MAG TPA: hypothetical protein VNK91_09580 [Burkholderiaceae bacterium]|nr:hypothetical protein [Burkholderiaceae bacterium]